MLNPLVSVAAITETGSCVYWLAAGDVEAPLFYPPPPLAVDSSTTRAETTAKQRSQSEPCKLALD